MWHIAVSRQEKRTSASSRLKPRTAASRSATCVREGVAAREADRKKWLYL